MDWSGICNKLDDSEEENESFRVSNCIEMKDYVHKYCALYTYVCNINNGFNCLFFSLKHNSSIYKYKYLINYLYSWLTRLAKMLNVNI